MSGLEAVGLSVTRGSRGILDRVSVALRPGELVALVGPNGAGKTTLLRALAGLTPIRGEVRIDGTLVQTMRPRERARTIAYLPQFPSFAWPIPAAEVVALGRQPHADPFGRLSAADRTAVQEALAATGAGAFAEQPVTTLSGGEQARIALARALATQARFLLADEPVVSLDPRHQLAIMRLLRTTASGDRSVLVVLHDLSLAATYADRVILLDRGRVAADGPALDVLSPVRIAAVFGIAVEVIAVDGRRQIIPLGEVSPPARTD